MNIKLTFPIIGLFLALSLGMNGQKYLSNLQHQTVLQNVSTDLPIGVVDQFFDDNVEFYGLTNKDEMLFVESIKGGSSHVHHRFNQYHNNLPVFAAHYTLHEKEGVVYSSTGMIVPSINAASTPSLSESQVVYSLKSQLKKQKLDVDNINFEQEITLCYIDPFFPQISGRVVLAYEVELASKEPLMKSKYYVDANSGFLIFESPEIMHQAVPGKAKTMYYGEVDITCDSISPNEFLLQDLTRSDGIMTLDENNELWTSESSTWDLSASEESSALDIHYSMEKFYDLMLNLFDWDGIDNDGGAIISVLAEEKFINAFWNGEFATFGRGDCNHGPLTTLEVVAHELAHGITQHTSQLIYSNESGAINESMSDIFGKALEYDVDRQNFTWYIGKSFLLNDYGRFFRSMIDPHERDHPKYYGGMWWRDGAGVHTNSSIGNHWFYQLVEGGMGTNEVGYDYDFEGLGMDKAMQIVFLTQSAYLQPSSDYQFYYEMSVRSAEELYGLGSTEVETVKEAWKIVGMPSQKPALEHDLAIELSIDQPFFCVDNDFASFDYTISNFGTKDFNPAVGTASIRLGSVDLGQLRDTIAPGETVTYTIDDKLLIDFFGRSFRNIRMIYSLDENQSNNSSFIFVENGNPNGKDISMFASAPQSNYCEAEVDVTIILTNLSCSVLEADTEVDIVFLDDGLKEISRTTMTLPELNSFENVELITTYQATTDITLVNMMVELTDDRDIESNDGQLRFSIVQPISEEHLEDFTNTYGPEFVKKGNWRGLVYDFQGEDMFIVHGERPTNNISPCAEAEDAVNDNPLGYFGTCLELNNLSNPELSFDMIQYRNEAGVSFPELSENTSVLRVSWRNENMMDSRYYYGLEEGVKVNQKIILPPFFEGELEFSFYCHTGNGFFTPQFLESDIIMLDNIQIKNTTSILDRNDITTLEVQPNPSDIFQISWGGGELINWSVQDISGKIISTGVSKEINLSQFDNGCYFLLAQFKDGKSGIAKLMKY